MIIDAGVEVPSVVKKALVMKSANSILVTMGKANFAESFLDLLKLMNPFAEKVPDSTLLEFDCFKPRLSHIVDMSQAGLSLYGTKKHCCLLFLFQKCGLQ